MKRLKDDELIYGDDDAMYYQGKPFTGICYDTRKSGELWSEVTYVRGLRHGVSRTLYPNGQLQSQAHYKMALAHGQKEEWYSDGRLKRRKVYELGSLLQEQEFDREGRLIRETTIDSKSLRRLEEKRRNEERRLEGIYAKFGRPDEGEN